MNHTQVLILFWSLFGLMVIGMSIVFTNPIHGQLTDEKPILGYFTFFSVMMFLPVMFLIPIIGSGRFHKIQKVKSV